MMDLLNACTMDARPLARHPARAAVPQGGLEGSAVSTQLLARVLDIVDYGIVMVAEAMCVVYANAVARHELQGEHPLQLAGSELSVGSPHGATALRQALLNALTRRMQSMVTLADPGGNAVSVAVIPLTDSSAVQTAVLVFGKRRVCEELSTDAFAREHALTAAETRVLKLLCLGRRPDDIARTCGVKLSTVRTQISRIRDKTESRDIGGIVNRIAKLPPLPCLTRCAA